MLGRVVPYKRVDLALAACARLGRRVKVVGRGARPTACARGPRRRALGFVPDEELGDVISGARALLFPGEEDFGIVPVEVQAAGVPVIAYGVGGIRDSVIDGETGLFFDEQSEAALADAIVASRRARSSSASSGTTPAGSARALRGGVRGIPGRGRGARVSEPAAETAEAFPA